MFKGISKHISIAFIAILLRFGVAWLGWNTSFFEAYDNSITVVYQRSAYLLAFGYGYQQALPESPAYYQLDSIITTINLGSNLTTNYEITENGRFNTSHYPPGLPLIGAGLFKITKIPIAYLYQILGILIDLVTIFYLFLLISKISTPKIANITVWLYCLSPQAISLSVSMTPDAYMPLLVVATTYYFLQYLEHNSFKYIIIIAVINGLGGYLRSDFILLPFAFNLLFLIRWNQVKLLNILKFNVAIAAISFTILTPWALHNKKTHGGFNPTSTSLGATLITGLSILPNPWNLGPTDYDRFAEAKHMGFDTPFESGANDMFTERFKTYIAEEPGYYAKTCLYRTGYFLTAPHGWGLEVDKYAKTYSELRNEGAAFGSFPYLLGKYWTQMLSAIFTLISFISLFIFMRKHSELNVKIILISVFLSVYLSHVFIHITSVYLMSLYPIQCFFIAYLITNFKFRKVGT